MMERGVTGNVILHPVTKKRKDMTQHAFIWLLTAGTILCIFVVRILQRFRREAGNGARLIEWAHDDDIHYEQDGDGEEEEP